MGFILLICGGFFDRERLIQKDYLLMFIKSLAYGVILNESLGET